jgi:hypothetical protein
MVVFSFGGNQSGFLLQSCSPSVHRESDLPTKNTQNVYPGEKGEQDQAGGFPNCEANSCHTKVFGVIAVRYSFMKKWGNLTSKRKFSLQ